jgi:hypothetical protein
MRSTSCRKRRSRSCAAGSESDAEGRNPLVCLLNLGRQSETRDAVFLDCSELAAEHGAAPSAPTRNISESRISKSRGKGTGEGKDDSFSGWSSCRAGACGAPAIIWSRQNSRLETRENCCAGLAAVIEGGEDGDSELPRDRLSQMTPSRRLQNPEKKDEDPAPDASAANWFQP